MLNVLNEFCIFKITKFKIISLILNCIILQSIRHALLTIVLPKVKIHELFQLNIDKIITEFQEKVRAGLPSVAKNKESDEELTIIPDLEFGRLTATIDMNKALKLYNIYRYAEYYQITIKKNISIYFT